MKNLIVAAAALSLGAGAVRADLITWGGGLGNHFYDSGASPLDSTFWFELGTFDAFTPTAANVSDWTANWHVFDRATTTGAGADPQWDPNLPMLLASAIIAPDGSTSKAADLILPGGDPNYIGINAGYDFRGKSAMIWVFNDRRTEVGAEWGLYTGSFSPANTPWIFPTSVALDCGCALGADFNLADISGNVIGTFVQSPGPDSTETTLTLTVVPEPGSAALLVAAALFLLGGRKRTVPRAGGARPGTPALVVGLAFALAAASGTVSARSIVTGSIVGGRLFDSSGVKLGGSFVIEVGSFGTFVPDPSNMSEWAAHWKVFDRAEAPAVSGWNPVFGYFASSANLRTNGTSSKSASLGTSTFAQGERGYLWVYNTKTLGPAAEWALITNNSSDGSAANDWLFPAPSDQTSFPLDWRLSRATAIIFGGLNGVEGSGPFSLTPATFDLQTHQTVPGLKPGSNAELSNLAISAVTLSPSFTGGSLVYSASAGNATASITLTPTAAEAGAAITVNGLAVGSGTATESIPLNVGDNTLTIVVTAPDGGMTKTYTVVVSRSGAPVLRVFDGAEAASPELADGQAGGVNFGGVPPGASVTRSFTLRNTGTADLTGLSVTKDGIDGGDFEVNTSGMTPTLAPGAATGFSVRFIAGAGGARGAAIHIASNDAARGVFDIGLAGTAVAAPVIPIPIGLPQTFNEGATLTLSATSAMPAGSGLTCQWFKDGLALADGVASPGQVIAGARTATLAITKAAALNEGVYTCRFSLNGVTKASVAFAVSVRLKPVINPAGPLAWIVSGSVDNIITAKNSPTRFSFANLPAGVSGSTTTGQLSGKPTTATRSSKTFVVTAFNRAGASAPVTVSYAVAALPAAVVGTFHGLVDRDTTLSAPVALAPGQKLQGLGGSLSNLVIGSNGGFTGTLRLEERSYSMPAGSSLEAAAGDHPKATVIIPRGSGVASLVLQFTIDRLRGELTGTLGDGSVAPPVPVRAWRQTIPPAGLAGSYTAVLEIADDLAGTDPGAVPPGDAANIVYPQGNGYVTLTIGSTGAVTWAGKLADGTVIAGGSGVGPGGDVPFHQLLYTPAVAATAGSVHGWFKTSSDTVPWRNAGRALLDGKLDWNKHAQSAGSSSRSYKSGFPLHSLAVIGGKYAPPPANHPVLGLIDGGAGGTNARLVFAEGGLRGPAPLVGAAMADAVSHVPLRISNHNIVTFPGASNPAGVAMVLTPSSGLIAGGFTLKNDPDPSSPATLLTRPVAFFGVLVPRLGMGVGQFQLAELPGVGPGATTLLSSPQLSGQMLLEP